MATLFSIFEISISTIDNPKDTDLHNIYAKNPKYLRAFEKLLKTLDNDIGALEEKTDGKGNPLRLSPEGSHVLLKSGKDKAREILRNSRDAVERVIDMTNEVMTDDQRKNYNDFKKKEK